MSARLADLPDVLTIRQLCAVLQISERRRRDLKKHGAFPFPELEFLPGRYSKAVVQRIIEAGVSVASNRFAPTTVRRTHALRVAQ